LNAQFGIEGVARFEPGPGGLTRLAITAPAAEAHLNLHGAFLTHYRPAGRQPVLWLTRQAVFRKGNHVHGGVPICHPWFAFRDDDPAAPLHGFAALADWTVEAVEKTDAGVAATLVLDVTAETNAHWTHPLRVRYRVAVGEALDMTLETANVGDEPATITEALHTYYLVSDVRNVRLLGLENTDYFDKNAGRPRRSGDEPLTFAGPTDLVFQNTAATCVLDDPGLGRRIRIEKSGSRSTVVWNPWAERAAAMAEYGDDEWPHMLCVETANALDNAVTIPPGETHTLTAKISVEV
jgi:D-hexose-6-phosphate mutarotase